MTTTPLWARDLDLAPHPEGGWYRETWRSDLTISSSALPDGYAGSRSAGTAILFLIMPGRATAWHTVRSSEIWLFHRGSPLVLEYGTTRETAHTHHLGFEPDSDAQPQLVIPAGHWQRARTLDTQPTLVSCVVVPGFDFEDFAVEPAE
jgi:predicted cupin superfamily sugar epimerase